jgi:predicted metal-dependent hydrolase
VFGLFQLDLPLFGAPRQGSRAPTPAAVPEERREIALAGRLLPYTIRRSARRRTLGLTIDSRGLRVATPLKARQSDIERLILDNTRWVLAKLAEWQQPEHAAGRPWTPADPVPILGLPLPLKRAPGRSGLSVFDDMLILTVPDPDDETQVRLRLREHLKEEARRDFLPRLARYCGNFGVATPELRLTRAATRWGSCSRDRDGLHRINLNWRMLHLAPRLIDYVVAHEVAHMKHMHHGPRFWAAVESLYPDHEAARADMRHVSARLPEI